MTAAAGCALHQDTPVDVPVSEVRPLDIGGANR